LEFPLSEDDKRHPNFAAHALSFLKRARDMMKNSLCVPSEEEKKQLRTILIQLNALLEKR
jgi:hypothetical protein